MMKSSLDWHVAAASSGARIITFVIDAATIAAVALVLAAFYCVPKIDPPVGFRLLFPALREFTFRYWSPDYFPWTDLAENIYLGFALAHGWPIFEAGTGGHMPGVPQLLGGWLWLFGFNNAVPSPQIAASAYLTASLGTLLLQTACVYVPLRTLSCTPTPAALVALVVCAFTAFIYDFAMPMSETLIAYLLVLVPLLAARMVLSKSTAERLVAAILLGAPLTFVCLLLGLTVASTNAVIAFGCMFAFGWELWSEPANRRILLGDRRCLAAYASVATLVLATVITVRTGDLYFWAVETNLYRGISPVSVLQASFGVHAAKFLDYTDPIGSHYPELLAALVVYFCIVISGIRRRSDIITSVSRLALFGALILVASVMTQWRVNAGYKSAPLFGLTLGVILLALSHFPPRWRPKSNLWLVPLWLLALGQIMFLQAATPDTKQREHRNAAFDVAKVCHLGETGDCRCVQGTVWGPQIFLLNDMRPCPNRFLTFNAVAGAHPITGRWISEDAHNPAVAFWTYEPDALMLDNGVPPEVIRYWRTQARCVSIKEKEALCFAGS
jgi:hypothetical protein